jgi:signal transduction histidine kinase
VYGVENQFRARDGTVLTTLLNAYLLELAGQQYALTTAYNVDDAKRAEAALLEETRLEGVLLAARTMGHELNNQLTRTVGYAELLANDPALPAHLRAAACDALAGALDAVALLDKLQQVARLRETDWGPDVPPTLDLPRSTE